MFRNRQRQQRQNLGVYLLAYQLMTAGPIPPVTLGAIALQVAIYLGFIPALDLDKTRSLCLIPYRIIQKGEWIRLLAPIVMHADDMHLYYNMASLLWKGRKLENWMGSVRFASVLAVLSLASSATAVLLSFVLDGFLQSGYSMQCAVGFSGVLFALKVLVSTYLADEDNYLFGWMPIPSKYVAWAELVLIQAITPNASFVGHLAGILAGLMYTYGPLRVLSDIVASPFLADGQNRRGPTAPRYENDDYDNVNDRPDERAFRGGAGYARRDDFKNKPRDTWAARKLAPSPKTWNSARKPEIQTNRGEVQIESDKTQGETSPDFYKTKVAFHLVGPSMSASLPLRLNEWPLNSLHPRISDTLATTERVGRDGDAAREQRRRLRERRERGARERNSQFPFAD
ncbi:hypothetical protein WR25_05723 [Diploscapter pachys]|uniref:Peptidase S54 rhomboid domain-containing protein n=1 Tax=Diploscapter pachys TaxID=2018661 RepID=A0A2A2LT17_9BILA|nr:hypothetical protein WR25_05723 [Diploscapter pachys]